MARAVNGFIVNRYPAIMRNRGLVQSRVSSAMRSLAQTTSGSVRMEVASSTPRSFGVLASSTKNKVVFDLDSRTHIGVVYQDAKRGGYHYAQAVQEGTNPGTRIPYRALIPWVQRNIPTPHPGRVAYFIASALYKTGQVGYDYSKAPREQLRRSVGATARAALLPQIKTLTRG